MFPMTADPATDNDEDRRGQRVAPFPQESLLIRAVAEMSGDRLLCTSPGLAQFAAEAAQSLSHAAVSCLYLDAYRANLAAEYWGGESANLRIECASDFPNEEADVVALPLSAGGEAELARDLVQAGHERLKISGKLYATSDKHDDTWLGEQLGKIFPKLEQYRSPSGVLYIGTKTEPLKKVKNYACEFAFRDRGRLIYAVSRPGVFSHRHIDTRARRLIDAMQIEPGARVLDIGCGAGTVALAAACRADGVSVHAVDSNARAVECTQRGAARNGFENLTTELNAVGNYADSGTYDLALANPPYYSGFRIARHFLTAARESLRPGGTLLLVTKHVAWYEEHMPQWFDDISMTELKGYVLIQCVRPNE
jgi:16S rRNA (guanine1207-N2)-methyltransferase